MLAEERAVSDAERALDLPLERFLDYLVRLEVPLGQAPESPLHLIRPDG